MNARSRSTLFLMEQLMVITIFAVCASICVKIFIGSYLMASDARSTNQALVVAKNGAECFKACGDVQKTAAVLGAAPGSADAVYYDAGWQVCGEKEAVYALRFKSPAPDENTALPLLCGVSVEKMTGEKLVGFTVSTQRTRVRRAGGAEDE